MPITGAHVLLYTSDPEGVRAVLRDVFDWHHVDAGDGWLIFALPPAEVGVHPAATTPGGAAHQLTLMCDDLGATVAELQAKGLTVRGEPQQAGWGVTTTLVLPGDLEVTLYEPRHPTAF
jgi:predicted enzyme related to lactoylglutathione lyase